VQVIKGSVVVAGKELYNNGMPALQNEETAWKRDKNQMFSRGKFASNVVNILSVPISSEKRVTKKINERIFLIFFHDSISSNWPAINWVARPTLTIIYMQNSISVISPSPPICISIRIILWPKSVKLSSETVKSPVTQVAEVAVNNKSMNGIGVSVAGAAENDNKKVLTVMMKKKENKITRPGEKMR